MPLPSRWVSVPFEVCLSDDTVRVGKVQKKDYLESGQYPVIDQSQEFVSGFTNQSDLVYQGDLPVILFGDHTLAFKYVDFPFVCGADGVKVLVPNKAIVVPEYFYFFLINLQLQSRGYSRHYKQLKKTKILVPPLLEQHRIANILRQAQTLRRWRVESNEKVKSIQKALFFEIFGDPDPKRNNRGWEKDTLGNIFEVGTGGTPLRSNKEYYGGQHFWVKTTELKDDIIYSTEETISDKGLSNSNAKIYPVGTVLVAMYGQGQTRGRTAKLGVPAAVNQACGAFLPSDTLLPDYLWYWFQNSYERIRSLGRGGPQENINLQILKELYIPKPPKDIQEHFVTAIQQHRIVWESTIIATNKLDDLIESITARIFTGELTALWREKHNEELQNSAVERDKALGLRGEKPRLVDFEEGRVTSEELEGIRQALGNFAVHLASYHFDVDGIARSLDEATKPLKQSLVSMSQNLITPFLESFRQSLQNIQLALPVPPDEEEINRQIDLLPLPQEKRAIHDVLDVTSLRVLKLAHASHAYFTAEDLTFGGITSTHTSASLRVLDSLGFVRLVEIDGVLRYHLINSNTDAALKPDQLQ